MSPFATLATSPSLWRTAMTMSKAMNHLPIQVAPIKPLQDWCFFWDWSVPVNQVRWMTAWDTTDADVDTFAAGVREFLDLSPAV